MAQLTVDCSNNTMASTPAAAVPFLPQETWDSNLRPKTWEFTWTRQKKPFSISGPYSMFIWSQVSEEQPFTRLCYYICSWNKIATFPQYGCSWTFLSITLFHFCYYLFLKDFLYFRLRDDTFGMSLSILFSFHHFFCERRSLVAIKSSRQAWKLL